MPDPAITGQTHIGETRHIGDGRMIPDQPCFAQNVPLGQMVVQNGKGRVRPGLSLRDIEVKAEPATVCGGPTPRPLVLFQPEPITARGPRPPARFRWRRMAFRTCHSTGPERIAPEWWLDDENWRTGLRDYWRVETCEGRRLWLFYTPQTPGWFVQGEFA